jgi:transposase
METGSGAHYWARELQKLGHTVRLMAPRFVKPYRKNDKSDRNDAEAILARRWGGRPCALWR